MIDMVFALFDRNGDGVVDLREGICGTTCICAGTEDDKIRSAFDLFDEDGDGVISLPEMFTFIKAIFKVVITPAALSRMNSGESGFLIDSAEDLASVTARECFLATDLNSDGKLSIEEFTAWFRDTENNGTPGIFPADMFG